MGGTYAHVANKNKVHKALTCLLVFLLSGVPGSLLAQFTSTISSFVPKAWEGKQAMVVAKPLHGPPIIDTATVVNRSAVFTVRLGEPCPAYLWIDGNKDDFHFFIDSPAINIGIDPVAFDKPVITGSISSEIWMQQRDLRHLIHESRPDLDLSADMVAALQAGDSLTVYRIGQMTDSLRSADNELIIKLIMDHPSLPPSWYLFMTHSFSHAQTVRLFASLSAFSSYPSYGEFKEKMSRKQLGNKAPDFRLPSLPGPVITLSTLKHKYILVDFFSPFLVACQRRHHDLKKLYNIYHPLGLEIVTVSFCFDENDGGKANMPNPLPWLQVLDSISQSSTRDAYVVEQMPDNVLLDVNKKMIGRDMSIRELNERLEILLKK